VSNRTFRLTSAVVLLAASALAFVLMVLALHHHDYAKATFDLLLFFGAQRQAEKSLDRIDER